MVSEEPRVITFYGRCDQDQAAWRYYRTELGPHYEAITPATSYVVTLVIMSGGNSGLCNCLPSTLKVN